jgi:serine O-acetyltransferase
MGRFRELVIEPFNEDVSAWNSSGWQGSGFKHKLLLLFRHNGMRATLIHRMAYWASEAHVPGLPTILSNLNVALHAIEIVPGVPIGGGLYMPHTVGTVINARSIGRQVTLQSGITIGLRAEQEFPMIEDGVTLAVGCRVLGAITIGEGATIGANAVVLNDVEPGSTMVGIPARAIGHAVTSALP